MNTKSLFKNISLLTIVQIGNSLVPLLIIPFLTRIISPEQFGQLEYAKVFCFYFSVVIIYGFDVSITRVISLNRKDFNFINNIISQTTYAKLFLFLISSIVCLISLLYFKFTSDLIFLILISYIINIGYALYPIWYFLGTENLVKFSTFSLIIKIVGSFLLIFILKEESNYWYYNLLLSLTILISGLYGYYLILKKKHYFVSVDFSFIKNLLKDGYKIFISIILMTVITSIYYLFVEKFSNEKELAKFSVSYKLITTIQIIMLLPFSQSFFPMISKLYEDNFIKFTMIIKKTSQMLFIITFIVGLVIYFLGDIFITILFGEKYLISLDSLKILAFLPMFSILNNLYLHQGILSLKKDSIFLKVNFFYAVLTILVSLVTYKLFDAFYSSFLRILIEFLMFLTSYFYYQRLIKNESRSQYNTTRL